MHPVLYTRSQKGYRRKVGAPPPSALFARQSFNGAQIGERKMRKPHFLTKSKKAKPKRIYYTSLFCSCGIGEYYLKQLGLYPGVAVELNPERAKFFQEMYPDCHVICGDIWDPAVFDEAVEWHKKMGSVGTMASCSCQSYSNANIYKDPTDLRGQLFLPMLKFVTKTYNEWVFNENVPNMLTIKSIGGVVVGDCIQKTLAYHGFKYIDVGVQTSWDFGCCQDRPRGFITASRNKPWKLPTPTGEHVTLEDVIGDLPSLEIGEYDPNHKGHDARHFTWSQPQIEVMRHTPTGSSAKHNPDPWKPCKVDGSPSNASFDCAFGRKPWLKTGTILQDSKSISGFRNCHPGRLLPDGTYSDARPLTLLEMVRCFSLPDSFIDEVPAWAGENFLRKALGEAVVPSHMLAIFKQIYP